MRDITIEQQLQLREWISSGRALELRRNAGVARMAVARELCATESAVWRWERGERFPRGAFAARYYRLLAALERRSAGRGARPSPVAPA